MIKKIVVIGPESTGKSTLCEQLAQHFRTIWCPEYAREYLSRNGVKYGYDDLMKITRGQLAAEDYYIEKVSAQWSVVSTEEGTVNCESSNMSCQTQGTNSPLTTHDSRLTTNHSSLITHPLLFIDTNMYVMKVWYEYVFGKCEQMVLNEASKRKYDLYLLCNIDLLWIADEMREYPEEQPRIELYNIYKDILINQTTPWIEISGNYEERLQKAIGAVERYCVIQ